MKQILRTWQCPKCKHIEHQPRTAADVGHLCPAARNKVVWFKALGR